jgi:hypothetical protein
MERDDWGNLADTVVVLVSADMLLLIVRAEISGWASASGHMTNMGMIAARFTVELGAGYLAQHGYRRLAAALLAIDTICALIWAGSFGHAPTTTAN